MCIWLESWITRAGHWMFSLNLISFFFNIDILQNILINKFLTPRIPIYFSRNFKSFTLFWQNLHSNLLYLLSNSVLNTSPSINHSFWPFLINSIFPNMKWSKRKGIFIIHFSRRSFTSSQRSQVTKRSNRRIHRWITGSNFKTIKDWIRLLFIILSCNEVLLFLKCAHIVLLIEWSIIAIKFNLIA